MIVRKFKKEDLSQVLELCREVRQYHIDILGGYFVKQDDELEKIGFLETLTNDKIVSFVAEYNNKIVGYILGEFKEAPYLINSQFAHISNFGVTQNLRNSGIGKRLMDTFCNLCKKQDIKEIRLGVYNQNTTAYKFYENYGFKPLEQKMTLEI